MTMEIREGRGVGPEKVPIAPIACSLPLFLVSTAGFCLHGSLPEAVQLAELILVAEFSSCCLLLPEPHLAALEPPAGAAGRTAAQLIKHSILPTLHDARSLSGGHHKTTCTGT